MPPVRVHLISMRLSLALCVVWVAQAVVCPAQEVNRSLSLRIPPVKTSFDLEGHPVQIVAWGMVSAAPSGAFRLDLAVDLGDFQQNLTPLMQAQLNRSDRCGERLSVERAELVPQSPSSMLTAWVHYERFACVKAFGKEIVKRLVGGNGVVEVLLTPSVADNGVQLAARVQKIDADGSLGELLRSGSLGDSLRQKIAASIESAIRKSANLKSALPPAMADVAVLQNLRFADGGAGRLWLAIAGEVRVSPEQFRTLSKTLAH